MQPHGKSDTGVDAGRNHAALKIAEPGRLRSRPLAARGLAAVLLATFAALLALPLQAQAQTAVPHDWSLIPSGLGPGDKFRLLFLSSTKRNGGNTNINTFNTFIKERAAAGHADIREYSDRFRVVGCTESKNATANTNTRASDLDAPIYWLLGGRKVANNYADFYDGSWDNEANSKNEWGATGPDTSQAANYPWTGCGHDGTEYFDSSNNSRALGTAVVVVGRPNDTGSNNGPISSDTSVTAFNNRPLYGLSPVFAVAGVPVKVRFGSTSYHAIEGGAEATVAVSMYPRPSIPVNIPLTVTSVGTTTAADYQIFVNGSLETSDRFSLTFSPDDSDSGAGGRAQRFTVRAVADSENDHRDSVRFRFGAMPIGTVVEGETDGRAAKTATVWLLGLAETQTETMDCTTPDTSAPNLGNLRNSHNPRRLNSKGQIKNSGDCVWFKVPNLANNRSHQFQLTGRWVQGVLSQMTSPQIKIYNSGGMPLVQDGSAVEDQVLEADRRFRAPLIRFTPATAGTYYVRASSLGYDVGHFTISYVDIGPGTAPATAAEPLTATLEDTPTNHDGSSAFTFRIAFSADVEITPEDMRDHALTVAGGTVTAAAQVDGRKDLWELTLEPAGSGPVSILTPLERACTETGALCTAEGVMLTVAPALQVAGPVSQGQQALAPLTAGFTSVPAEHDGQTAFWLELGFGAAVVEGSKQRIRALLGATGGSVTRMRRKDGRLDHWRIKIQPSSHEAVTVTLSPSPPCGAAGAVCTEDGRTFTTALATRIQGPPGLTVADAEVQEGPNAVLSFAVTLSRAPSSTVTVDYATADGTATAGSDYTAVNGALTFAAGETEKTVSVAVLDDAHDEGSETLTLSLSNASGAYIEDGTATGTIKNTDHMPKAWLARFGRTVAEQVLDAVGARVEGNSNYPGPAQLTLGGHQVVLDASWRRAEDTLLGEAGVLGQDLRETRDLLRAEADASPVSEVSTAEFLMASSLHLASADGGKDDARWSLWARGSRSSFSGREDALTLEGDVSTGVMGADYERGRVLAGVAIAYSTGEGSYTEADARGEVESTLLSAYPYLRYTLSERLSVWGVLGLGEGGLTLDMKANENANDEHIETDISLAMAAFGARGKLASVAGYDLAVKTDVLFVRTESEAVTGLVAADARTRRLRLALEGSREVKFESGVLTPSLEIGLRHDGGDAETGSGLELGGGLRWAGLKGFSVEVRARGLLAHEESDYEEWGVSASIGLSPGEGDRGFSMRVGSAWGAAAGGVERLWSQRALAGSSFDPDARLDAEVGYGLDAMRGLLTPYTGVALSSGGETWRAGARFRLSSALEVSLEASLTEPAGDGEPASGLVLRGTKRW